MRAVIQRVTSASVEVEGAVVGKINTGLLVLLGIEDADAEADADWLVNKIVQLRIFNDDEDVMNLSLKDVGGDILLISQFTLFAATKKGNRPSYIRASKGDVAMPMYEGVKKLFEVALQKPIQVGVFGADMKVSLLNDGPVTIIIDTKTKE